MKGSLLDRELLPALETPPTQYVTATSGAHTSHEAMPALTPSSLGLVGPFRHKS